jgi:hypothetical protein
MTPLAISPATSTAAAMVTNRHWGSQAAEASCLMRLSAPRPDGVRAALAPLREAPLREAPLREAAMRLAPMREAQLWEAPLWEAPLWEAPVEREAAPAGAGRGEGTTGRLATATAAGAPAQGASRANRSATETTEFGLIPPRGWPAPDTIVVLLHSIDTSDSYHV